MNNTFDYNRINQKYSYSDIPINRSIIWRYLRNEIDELLSPTISSLRTISFDDAYVQSNDEYYEKILYDFYKKKSCEQNIFLTGLTGCGKSTLLDYVFRIFNDKPVFKDNTIIIPFRFDNFDCEGNIKLVNKRIINMLLSAGNKIKEHCRLLPISQRENDFINYIEDIHSGALYFEDEYLVNSTDILKKLYCEDRWTFAAMQLKFYLSDENCTIDNVVFVLDDIESIGFDLQFTPVMLMFKLKACMHNILETYKQKWNNNFIISCRHFIYREIVHRKDSLYINEGEDNKYSTMESYEEFQSFDLSKTVSLIDIIEKRYTVLSERSLSEDKKTAFQIVKSIILKIKKNSNNLIENLNLNDLRKSFECLKKLVYNVRWIQREQEEETPGAFTISNFEQFNVYYANILRAISLNNSYIYDSEYSIVPNLLKNSTERYSNLTLLLIINYFLKRHTDWEKPINLDNLHNYINCIFNDGAISAEFKSTTCKMLIHRLLLRGADASQKDNQNITLNNVHSIKVVYLPKITKQLWELLSVNSILFQVFVDDIFLRQELVNDYRIKDEPFFDTAKFELCCDVLNYLIGIENEYINKASNRRALSQYISCFSKQPVTKQLYIGLNKSVNVYYQDTKRRMGDIKYRVIESKLEIANQAISELEEVLNDC